MRCTVFLFILFSTVGSFAGTYQDEVGNHMPLKTKDGNDHPFDGHLAPNSSRQNVDLTNADFTRGWRKIGANSTKQAEQALARQKQLLVQLRSQIRNLEATKMRINIRLAKLERQLEDIPESLNAPEVKEDLILQTKRQMKPYLAQLSRLDEVETTLNKQSERLRRSLTAVADLRGIDLRGAKLENATLDGVLLAEANLAKTDLNGTSLLNVDLSDANMRNIELGAAQLTDADLSRANLRGAGVYAADFTRVNLSGAILRDVDGWEEAVWTDAYYQADDPPWWPDGMDAKKFNIREVKSEEKSMVEETLK